MRISDWSDVCSSDLLLVDDAIIAIEIMVVRMQQGVDRVAAAAAAWSTTAAPMLSGTLVTVIGFIPIGLAPSGVSEFSGALFWVVGFALIASWFVAVLVIPYLGVNLLPDIPKPDGAPDKSDRSVLGKGGVRPC